MAKSAASGEMRTRITIKTLTAGTDADGFSSETWTNPFGGFVRCKWVYAHGTDALTNVSMERTNRLEMSQLATITMRFSSLVTPRCKIWRENETGEASAWAVVSVNDPEDRHAFLEVLVRRVVSA